MLPQDPAILLSVVNTRLRDGCPSLEELCRMEGADRAGLEAALAAIGFSYDPVCNQFR